MRVGVGIERKRGRVLSSSSSLVRIGIIMLPGQSNKSIGMDNKSGPGTPPLLPLERSPGGSGSLLLDNELLFFFFVGDEHIS